MHPKDFNSNQYRLPLMDMGLVHSSVEVAIPLRRCVKCGENKPYSEFNKSSRTKDKKYSYCKSCAKLVGKEHQNKNKEAIKERKHNWYKENIVYG